MARKPAHLQALGKLTPRERIWAAIRELKCFSVFQIARHLHIDDRTVESYVFALRRAGHVTISREAKLGRPAFYGLTRDTGVDAPRLDSTGREVTQGRVTLALWRSMKIHKQFDHRELAAWASIEDRYVAPNTSAAYCQVLARAGYLQIVRPSKPGTPARYRLAKYTGPKAPQIQRVRHLYDPNLGQVVWHPEVNS